MNFIAVALGGATGSVFRYLISLIPFKPEFPFLTFITNVLGAILIGVIVGFSSKLNLNKNLVLFFQTGLCGGFTTFSTFSLESYNLIQDGNYFIALTYIVLSVICCIIGVLFGQQISKVV